MRTDSAARARDSFLNANLQRRVISAAVGIPLLLLAVVGGLPWVSAVALGAAVVTAFELTRLAGGMGLRRYLIAFPALSLAAAGVAAASMGGDADSAAAAGVFAGAAAALGVASAVTARATGQGRPVLVAWAAVYFGALLAHAPGLAAHQNGREWLLMAVLGTFAVDSGAYFAGRAVGRHKLAPRISPKKTWEGAAGGLAAGVGAAIGTSAIIGPDLPAWQAAMIGVAIAAGGTLGDLAESALKRAAGVKHAGAIIPGHGGILDRIDSLAPNLAIVYWLAVWSAQ